MKSILLTILFIGSFITLNAQIYNHPGGTVNTCSGTFYDTGGSAGNYANNQNITTTFCSNAGNCIRVAFTAFNLENTYDFLYIYDGPTTGSTLIGAYTGATSPGTITSSTGCLTFRFTSDGSVVSTGWAATISCVACPPPGYTHPTVGIAGEYVGSCLVTDCGPSNYYDNGGAGGNYANNINNIYRVFCPNTAGRCMRVTFNSFDVETTFDYLTIGNGPTQNSAVFTTAPANGAGRIWGTPATPFSYTSTDASGCLTFRFFSDNVVNRPGWNAVLQCVPCAGGPNGTDNSDCQSLTPLCSGAPIATNSTGPGIVAEGCGGNVCPAGGENHSNWYQFVAQTTGTLSVTITPNTATDDYDFAIYGPNTTCSALGSPLRCSDSGTPGTTGATAAGTGTTQDVTAPFPQVSQLNVIAGQSYILVVDKWSPALASGYTLSFGGSASLDCAILPIELAEFNVEYQPELNVVDVHWITNSEHNSDYFIVEKSTDGINFDKVTRVNAAGNTTSETQYYTVDDSPNVGMNYYRLNQFDLNGGSKYSEIRAVNILDPVYDMISVFPNPTTGLAEVIFNSYSKEEVLLTITEVNGKILVNTPLLAENGGNRFNVDMNEHKQGVYIITIITKDKVYKTKLVKN